MERLADGAAMGRWWRPIEEDRIECLLCPRNCRLHSGDRGFCFVRSNRNGQMVLDTYGRSTGFCIDPIEKKPLNQFLPGTPILSFGTAGCNLGCKFCQNWDISKSREVARLSDQAEPEDIAQAALQSGCRAVAFTYNDPVIWAEYAIDVARACRRRGIKTVAVTAGYISPGAREEFFAEMDAANVDLKAFTEAFYFKVTSSHLQPVLDTLCYLKRETNVWFEITNLVIPQENDAPHEIRQMSEWIASNLGFDVPLHFSAFHPDWRMQDRPRTPVETLIQAYEIAKQTGLRYVYVGNVHDVPRQSTYCPHCHQCVIARDWYDLVDYRMKGNLCLHCGGLIAGHYEATPGDWGRKRQPIRIQPSTTYPLQLTSTAKRNSSQDALMSNLPNTSNPRPETPTLDPQSLQQLQKFAAREVIRAVVGGADVPRLLLPGELAERPVFGVFVTLKKHGALRSCCGSLGESQPLAATTIQAAKRTALEDPRFPPVSPNELNQLRLSVSVLGPPQRIDGPPANRAEQIEVGKHGLRIFGNNKAGLLLPSVAPEQGWDAVAFLKGVCRKAGLHEDAWTTDQTIVERFEGQLVEGEIENAQQWMDLEEATFPNEADVQALTLHAKQNIAAVQEGRTPAYYALDVTDGTIGGIVLQVTQNETGESSQWLKWSVRPGLPLQATLFSVCEQAGHWLREQNVRHWTMKLAFLTAPMPCGMLSQPNLDGFRASRCGVLVADGQSAAFAFDRQVTQADELVASCSRGESFMRARAQVIIWNVASAMPSMFATSSPQPVAGPAQRPPAVAGAFYPANDQEREQMIDRLTEGFKPQAKERVAAIMTPHAGLVYSGRLAADVWRRVQFPSSVLIIGPKHTPHGVRWAVAPHSLWRISPTTTMASDTELARAIAEQVRGMRLDSSAHAREHGIEVQLPLLVRYAPQVKVTGVCMGAATWEEIEGAAEDLSQLLRSMAEPPLLVISSDMNHFADYEETRRRDGLALMKLRDHDPRGLLETCQREQISMCGQIPAALVLLTLQKLGLNTRYEQVGYATSADMTGNSARVVGYAGALWHRAGVQTLV